jgi:hypothetical protein
MGERQDDSELDGKSLDEGAAADWEQRVTGLPAGAEREPSRALNVVVKVARAGYVPERLRVRANVSSTLLTGETTFGELPALAADPLVVSVAVGERIEPVAR